MKEFRKYRFKIIVIGDSQVGKTTLMKKLTKSSFAPLRTQGVQFSVFDSEVEGYPIRLLFWQISAQDTFLYFRPRYFKNSRAAIIIFNLEDNV